MARKYFKLGCKAVTELRAEHLKAAHPADKACHLAAVDLAVEVVLVVDLAAVLVDLAVVLVDLAVVEAVEAAIIHLQ